MLYDFPKGLMSRAGLDSAKATLAKHLATRAIKDNDFLKSCGIAPVQYRGVPYAEGIWVGIHDKEVAHVEA